MRFLRSLAFLIYLIVWTIPYATFCFIVFPFVDAHRRYWIAARWCRITLNVLRAVAGVRYRVEGMENLPPGPAVLLSKHQSAWETIAFPALMPHPLCYVLKRELVYVPFFGWALGLLKMIYIDRSAGRQAFASVIRQGRERMADGSWVIMFPEGTRTRTGTQGQYKTGGVRFAIASGAPVVPVAHNAGRCWPRNSFLKYPGLVTLSIGPPIASTGLKPDELNARVEQWIEAEMRRLDPAAYGDAGDTSGTSGTGGTGDTSDRSDASATSGPPQ